MKYSFRLVLIAKLYSLTPKSCLKRERKDTLSLFDRTEFRVHAHSKRTRGKSSIRWLPAEQSLLLVEPDQRGMNGIFFPFMEAQTELCVVESHHRTYQAITCTMKVSNSAICKRGNGMTQIAFMLFGCG